MTQLGAAPLPPEALEEPLVLAERLRSEVAGLETVSVAPGTLQAQVLDVLRAWVKEYAASE